MPEHSETIRVRYGETDQMGVVYHSNYLHYFEVARTELLRTAGVAYSDLEKQGIFLVVTEAACRYRAPALYDELLRITARVSQLGKARVRFDYEVRNPAGRLLTEGHTELASVDRDKNPVRLPEDVVRRLSP